MGYFIVYGFIVSFRGRPYYNFHFFRVLRHELTHATVALLFGSHTEEMLIVNPVERPEEVSYVKHYDPLGPAFLITLAPYCLPIFTIPFLLLKLLPLSQLNRPIDFLIGFTLAFHFLASIYEFAFKQDDIERTGALFSLVLVLFFNLVFLVITKVALHQDWSTIIEYFSDSVARSQESYKFVIEEIRRQGLLSGG